MAAMDYNLITATDIKQLEKTGISASEVCTQIAFLKNGVLPVKLNRPCRAGDGIVVISDAEKTNLIARHEETAARGRFMKFVPASGAASRMFVQWQSAL